MKKTILFLLLAFLISTSSNSWGATVQNANSDERNLEASTEDAASERAAFDAFEVRPIPQEYRTPTARAGKIVRLDYETDDGSKFAYVYVPYGYNRFTKYDVLYLMHGGGDNQGTFFGDDRNPSDLKNVVDRLIENGEMAPILIVMPTYVTQSRNGVSIPDAWNAILQFPEELSKYLIPAVESVFSTYAESVDDEGLTASRDHRAFGGFSMGSAATWLVFQKRLRHFARFLPISGDCWTLERQGGKSKSEETAKALADSVKEQGYTSKDFKIYAITGDHDIAEPNMTPMLDAMKRLPETFEMDGDGVNTWYFVKTGGWHSVADVKEYMYNLLPVLY